MGRNAGGGRQFDRSATRGSASSRTVRQNHLKTVYRPCRSLTAVLADAAVGEYRLLSRWPAVTQLKDDFDPVAMPTEGRSSVVEDPAVGIARQSKELGRLNGCFGLSGCKKLTLSNRLHSGHSRNVNIRQLSTGRSEPAKDRYVRGDWPTLRSARMSASQSERLKSDGQETAKLQSFERSNRLGERCGGSKC